MTEGWNERPLGEVCTFLNRGVSPKYVEHGGICVLNQRCIRDHEVSFGPARRHDVRAKVVAPERHLRAGDVLVNSTGTGTLGRVAQLREPPSEPTTVDSHVTIVRPSDGLFVPEFFGYMLVAIEDQIKEGGEGCGGQTELARTTLAERFRVRYPTDKWQQRRIVGILDEAFNGIGSAKANAKKNLQNARAVFESRSDEVFSKPGGDWVASAVGSDIRFIDYRGRTPRKTESGIRLITAKNVKMGFVQDEPMEYVAPDSYDGWMTRGIPKRGDVLFTTEAPLGNVAQLDTDEKVAFAQRIIIMQPNRSKLDPTFLKYMLLSPPVQRRIREKGTGATALGIKASLLKKIPIDFPREITAQASIARHFDELEDQVERLDVLYNQKVTALDELRNSLLHQAFSGAL